MLPFAAVLKEIMFSFIHAADLHLDSPLRGLSRHEGAPVEEIRGATRRALENLVELAIGKGVNFIVIAGDLYDGDQKDFSTALFFNQQMLRLKSAGIPVFAIKGNHDAVSVITKSLTPPDNVLFFPSRRPDSVALPQLPVTIHGQSFANASVPENLATEYPEADSARFNIGLLHTSLAGSQIHDTYAPCSVADLERKGYQYWALGHIHQPEVVNKDPLVVYSGNIQGRKINETGGRGCYLVQVDDSLEVSSHEFFPLDVVRWAHLRLEVSSLESCDDLRKEITSTISKAASEAGDRLLAIRLTLAGASPLHGELHSNPGQWQAECVSIAQDINPDGLWFEQLKLATTPTYDVAELARRDELTALVLEALDDFEPDEKPAPLAALEAKLPPSVMAELEEGELKEEVAAIVLHGITTSRTD